MVSGVQKPCSVTLAAGDSTKDRQRDSSTVKKTKEHALDVR